ncbi:hypothetical protein [Chondromyces apiculatus]|uniref:Lipoprotein n=1 Tax=Chondromyces apiculatus DSM 436 TaxID=1192034 RepID=A0A017T6Q8_9BACT|nr:hypothetical protein [Chondromyces apiculatus]EYF04909.1 Hypothetical protein CAP_3720 [Chondromyces apiculatus DSM 436]
MRTFGIVQAAVVAALGLAAAGCQPEIDDIQVVIDSQPPGEASFSKSEFRITHGTAVAVSVTGVAEGEELESAVTLHISAYIRVVERVPPEDTDTIGSRFVLIADEVGEGTATVSTTDSGGELFIPVVVVPQAP